jgi:hypothetical protein
MQRGMGKVARAERERAPVEEQRSEIGLRQRNGEEVEVTGRDIWLSVTYAWHIMLNVRHAYLTLSQIPRGSSLDTNTSLPQWEHTLSVPFALGASRVRILVASHLFLQFFFTLSNKY